MSKLFVAYFVIVYAYLFISTWRDKRRWRRERAEHDFYAYCKCGQRMSEWFLNDGLMWHPIFARGCGWISPWTGHEDYRDNRNIVDAKKRWPGGKERVKS